MHHQLPIHLGYVYLAGLVQKTSRIFRKNTNAPTSTAALSRIRGVSKSTQAMRGSRSRLPDHSGDVPATWLCKIAHSAKFASLAKIALRGHISLTLANFNVGHRAVVTRNIG